MVYLKQTISYPFKCFKDCLPQILLGPFWITLSHMCLCTLFEIVYPFQPSVTFHRKTSHLICCSNQMACFYMKCNTGLKWVNRIYVPIMKRKNYVLVLLFSQIELRFYSALKDVFICPIENFR